MLKEISIVFWLVKKPKWISRHVMPLVRISVAGLWFAKKNKLYGLADFFEGLLASLHYGWYIPKLWKCPEKLHLESLDQRRIQLCEKFAKSCLKSSHTSTMFPVNVQYNHDRIQKKSENYKVQFARTERLRKSAIPYMQRLLNSEEN